MAPRILFLDDDPVIRVLRMVLSDAEDDPWVRDYFAPEKVDPSRLVKAAKGLRRSDGAVIGLASDGKFEDATAIVFRRGEVNRDLLARHPTDKLRQRLGRAARHDRRHRRTPPQLPPGYSAPSPRRRDSVRCGGPPS